jgi:phospholipid transport system substrate-binding protein
MKSRLPTLPILALVCGLAVQATAAPVGPGEVVRDATEKILKMVRDPALQGQAKATERRDAMIKVVDQVFDWDLMARLAMGKYWRRLKKDQQDEFVPVFKDLIVTAYLGHVESYSGEKLVYDDPVVDAEKGRAEVKALVKTEAYGDVDLLYKLYRAKDAWLVRDVSVLGVSLVRNYRTQLYQLMSQESFKDVMARLRAKIEEQRKSGGAKLK